MIIHKRMGGCNNYPTTMNDPLLHDVKIIVLIEVKCKKDENI